MDALCLCEAWACFNNKAVETRKGGVITALDGMQLRDEMGVIMTHNREPPAWKSNGVELVASRYLVFGWSRRVRMDDIVQGNARHFLSEILTHGQRGICWPLETKSAQVVSW